MKSKHALRNQTENHLKFKLNGQEYTAKPKGFVQPEPPAADLWLFSRRGLPVALESGEPLPEEPARIPEAPPKELTGVERAAERTAEGPRPRPQSNKRKDRVRTVRGEAQPAHDPRPPGIGRQRPGEPPPLPPLEQGPEGDNPVFADDAELDELDDDVEIDDVDEEPKAEKKK